MGAGQQDLEFKLLAEWYRENAKPGEKVVTSMGDTVGYFVPEHKDSVIHIKNIGADSPAHFVSKCNDMEIKYVTWDSRIGLRPRNAYYRLWGIKNIAMLDRPQNTGPYEFITQIKTNEKRFINIFRLRRT
jgi:hypothetical protein